MRCPLPIKNKRRVLCVFPIYTPSFGTFQHAYKLMYRVKAFMPPQQIVPQTKDRLPLTKFPIPAYDRIPFGRYLLGTIQFSSGCPYLCEFCDIPGLYGRQPRMKTPQQIVAELDFIFAQPNPPATLYFVDDNFIGNRKAAKEMLPHLVEWQKKHSYPVMLASLAL